MFYEKSRYQVIKTRHVDVETAEFVNFDCIDLQDPNTYKDTQKYIVIGQIPFPYPQTPYPNYRAHHLSTFFDCEADYALMKNFYKDFPENAADETLFWLDCASNLLAITATDDFEYSGGTPEGSLAFIEAESQFLQSLFYALLDTLVCVSILPDGTCFACQSTGRDKIARHCHSVTMRDIEVIQAIIARMTQHNISGAYVPFLQSPEGIPLGIITSKRNLYIWAGRKVD